MSLTRNRACVWDFAAAWRREESGVNGWGHACGGFGGVHHGGLHWERLLFALMCGIGLAGILRPSAFLFCTRSLVILPRGVWGVWDLCWPRIPMPKLAGGCLSPASPCRGVVGRDDDGPGVPGWFAAVAAHQSGQSCRVPQ